MSTLDKYLKPKNKEDDLEELFQELFGRGDNK